MDDKKILESMVGLSIKKVEVLIVETDCVRGLILHLSDGRQIELDSKVYGYDYVQSKIDVTDWS